MSSFDQQILRTLEKILETNEKILEAVKNIQKISKRYEKNKCDRYEDELLREQLEYYKRANKK